MLLVVCFVRWLFALVACFALCTCRPRSTDTPHTTSSPSAARPNIASVAPPSPAATPPANVVAAPARAAWTEHLHLAHAPFASHDDVLVHASPTFDPTRPLRIVIFLHGWFGCVDVIAGSENAPCTRGGPVRYAMDVVAQFDRANVDALLVIPQLAFDLPSSSPGRLGDSGGLRNLMGDVLADSSMSRHSLQHNVGDIARVVVLAHSGAFVPAALLLARGGLDVQELHMLDALYRPRPEIEAWFASHVRDFAVAPTPRRLSFIYTDREGTASVTFATVSDLSTLLASRAPSATWRIHRSLDTAAPDDLLASPLFVLRTSVTHETIPRVFLAPLLDSSPALHD